MKKVFLFFIFIITVSSQAQFHMFSRKPLVNLENFDKSRLYYGYFLGFNNYDFKFDYKTNTGQDILVKSNFGFNVGLIGNLRFNDYFSLRFEPGLYLNQRDMTFPGFTKNFDAIREVKSTYIHLPLLIKFSSQRIGNVKPFLLGGVGTAINLSSNASNSQDNSEATFRMKQWTNFYEVGIGIDLYLEYFKFSPSVRGVFSFEDELIRDKDANSPWTGNVSSMQTRGVFVNFTFQ